MNPSRKARRRNWQLVFDYFGGRKCQICGEADMSHPIYELHHTHPERKEYNVSAIMHHSWEKIKEELDKGMILICANCHKRVHHIERKRREK